MDLCHATGYDESEGYVGENNLSGDGCQQTAVTAMLMSSYQEYHLISASM